jgi:malonyl-CoA/methylmalonyl-CoA synthetase
MTDPIPLVARAQGHPGNLALVEGDAFLRYAELLAASSAMATVLLDGRADLACARVALLTAPGIDHVVAQWAIWRAGGVAVPLCTAHPPPELAYVLDDAEVSLAVCDAAYAPTLLPLCDAREVRVVPANAHRARTPSSDAPRALPCVAPERDALVIYTSGTTGKPKGAVSTHAILAAQIRSVVDAWSIDARDRIVHALPLHHLHGILNALCAPLWAGAMCEMLPRFDTEIVWQRLAAGSTTLFMGVPTMYAKLTQAWDAAPEARRHDWSRGAATLRLMVSGSAALPVAQFERWRAITGHTLLERYGMTELGMILGNALDGERRPGAVGVPFPGVDVRLWNEHGEVTRDESPGEIQVRGPGVFAGYWRRPDATREAFTEDGWFRTGDVAVRDRGAYRILGRDSVDILKTGGYKVSALEIEETLRGHPGVAECAVVGVPDTEWGQRVGAAVVLKAGAALDLDALRAWGKERLAPYKVPTLLRLVEQLPRNTLGKVQKPEVVKLFRAPA